MVSNYHSLIPPIIAVAWLLILAHGSHAERTSAVKCREYKEFYRETFAPRVSGRDPIQGKLKCPRFKRVYNPSLKRDVFMHESPHTASLWYTTSVNTTTSGYKFRCSGTLISRRHVLAPGHCIYSKLGKPTHVMFGDNNLYHEQRGSKRQVIQVSDIILHPNYVPPSHVDDIAIIVLRKGVKFDTKVSSPMPSVRPACLPVENQPITHGVALTAFETREGNLRTERVNLFKSNHDCEPILRTQEGKNFTVRFGEGMRRRQFCSDGLSSSTCVTDLGASLTIQPDRSMTCIDTLIGIISLNSVNCQPGEDNPIVYTKVEHYLDWIESRIWPKQPQPADLLLRSEAVTSQPSSFNLTEIQPQLKV